MKMWSCEDRNAPFVDVFKRTATRAKYEVCLIAPSDPPAGFSRLKSCYRNLSPNPARFELASFRRWYEIADKVSLNDRFVLADSDLLVMTAWSDLPAEICEHEGLVGSIGATGDVLEEGINGGFSVWTGKLLKEFCEYMTDTYERDLGALSTLHAKKIAEGDPRASISDMTLLYRWVKQANIPFLNTNRLIRDSRGNQHYIDHNFFMPEGLGVRFAMALGRKAVRHRTGGIDLLTREGEVVIADSLHLGGRYKIMATDLETANRVGLVSKSAYIYAGRKARAILARFGVNR